MHWLGSVSGSSLLRESSHDHSGNTRPWQSPDVKMCALSLQDGRWALNVCFRDPPTKLNEEIAEGSRAVPPPIRAVMQAKDLHPLPAGIAH